MSVMKQTSLIIFGALLCSPVVAAFPQNQTYMQVADNLWNDGLMYTPRPNHYYINTVHDYVWSHINYERNPAEYRIRSPNLTWEMGNGSCSEVALLETAMLNYKGIDAHPVLVQLPNLDYHETVEIHDDTLTYTIDNTNYIKKQDGLMRWSEVVYKPDEPRMVIP